MTGDTRFGASRRFVGAKSIQFGACDRAILHAVSNARRLPPLANVDTSTVTRVFSCRRPDDAEPSVFLIRR